MSQKKARLERKMNPVKKSSKQYTKPNPIMMMAEFAHLDYVFKQQGKESAVRELKSIASRYEDPWVFYLYATSLGFYYKDDLDSPKGKSYFLTSCLIVNYLRSLYPNEDEAIRAIKQKQNELKPVMDSFDDLIKELGEALEELDFTAE